MTTDFTKQIKALSTISCMYCGCTQSTACIDSNGIPCHWVNIDFINKTGVCSVCFYKNKEKDFFSNNKE